MGTVSSREAINRRKIPSLRSQRKSIISSTTDTNIVNHPVKLVKHQVVVADKVSPMSSLSAAIIAPVRKSASWRKSSYSFTALSKTSSTSEEEEEEDDMSSPRTSTGSDNNGFLKINYHHRHSLYDTNYSDPTIVFEAKYHLNQQQKTEKKPSSKNTLYCNDEKEYDRQLRQHYVLKQIMNGNMHVSMSGQQDTILNSACGAGLWAMDIAQEHPEYKVIALDLFDTLSPNDSYKKKTNITYKYGNIAEDWDIPDNSVDVIFQRDAIDRIPKAEWPRLLKQFYRVAKQDAYLELVEYKFAIKDPGPALAILDEWHKIILASIGVDPNQTDYLEPLLRESGFQDVKSTKIIIPVGEWPAEKGEREKGFLYKQVIQIMFKSIKPSWMAKLGLTDAEFTKVTNTALCEFEEQHASVEWTIITARKA